MAVIVVGGGPSLRGFDWSRLRGAFTIACNRAAESFEADWHIGIDSSYWNSAARTKARTVAVDYGQFPLPKVDVILPCAAPPCRGNRHWEVAWGTTLEQGVGCGGHTGFAALNLADLLAGPDELIYLLGYDMQGEGGHSAHFHSGYGFKQGDHVYARYLDTLRWAADHVRHEVRVVGPSAIDWWPRAEL